MPADYYDIDALEELARELGFAPLRESPDELSVAIGDLILSFQNLREQKDAVAGFKCGAAAHWHGKLLLTVGDDAYKELDELDVLRAIRSGEVLVQERYTDSTLVDRWLVHRDGRQDFRFMECGEEERVRRLC